MKQIDSIEKTDFIEIGKQKGYIQILNEGTTIHYIAPNKKYRFTELEEQVSTRYLEEQVRARYYVELIERYQYPATQIDLEVAVPRRTPSDFADIVIFKDAAKKNPHIVIECKKDGISEAGFDQAIEQAFGNCNSLRGHYAACHRRKHAAFFLMSKSIRHGSELRISSRMFRYGMVKLKNGDIRRGIQIGIYKSLKGMNSSVPLKSATIRFGRGEGSNRQLLLMNSLRFSLSKFGMKRRRDRTVNPTISNLKRMNALNRLPTESKGCIKRQEI